MVIIGTVLLQSATAGPLTGWLKVAEINPEEGWQILALAKQNTDKKTHNEPEIHSI